MAAMESGTDAARGPMVVPRSAWVSGSTSTSRITKGTERITFTASPPRAFAARLSRKSPRSVTKSRRPRGIPRRMASVSEMPTIWKVSRKALPRSTRSSRVASLMDDLQGRHPVPDPRRGLLHLLRGPGDAGDEGADGVAAHVLDAAVEDVHAHVEAARHLGDHRLLGPLAPVVDAQDAPVGAVQQALRQLQGLAARHQLPRHLVARGREDVVE